MAIDDRSIEQIFQQFRRAISTSQEADLENKQALVERFRVELMITPASRGRKAIYRSVIDMLEDSIEEEVDRLDASRPKASAALVQYMKRLLDGLD